MRVVIHESVIVGMMQPGGEIGRAAERAAHRARDRAKRYAPVDTGRLRNSIIAELSRQTPKSVTWAIGSDVFYAPYQELGVGPIFPRRARALVFKINGQWISTQMTRGVPAVHYLQRAIDEVSAQDFQ